MWRLAALALPIVVVAFASVTPVRGGSTASDRTGDADCSGAITPEDVSAVLRDSLQLESAPCGDLGDADCDGDFDPRDALHLLRYQAGFGPELPWCVIGEPPVPTSEDLIGEAFESGDITYEESLLFRAYALFDHPSLPNEFRSQIPEPHAATDLLAEVLFNQDQLTAELLAALAPFIARPADPVSIFNNPPAGVTAASQTTWTSMPAAGGNLRVWVKGDPEAAETRLNEYAAEATRVWDSFPGIFRYGLPDTPGDPASNPDSAIDIYFADLGEIDPRMGGCHIAPQPAKCVFNRRNGGYTGYVAPFSGNTSASFVMIHSGVSGTLLTSHIAHELMHTGQHAYDALEGFWLKDATATWGAVKVLQALGESRQPNFDYLPKFFYGLDKPLTRDTEADLNRYGSWLYFLFASMEEGDDIVTQVWQNAAANGIQGERAVNDAIAFDESFDDFTVRNWNRGPVDPLYSDGDGDPEFPGQLRPSITGTHLATPDEHELQIALEPLSAKYELFTFDDSVRRVVFDNKWAGTENWHVWALVRIGDEWEEPADWTGDPRREFCRDDPQENITELALIVSNSHMTSSITPSNDAILEGKADGCSGFSGYATMDEVSPYGHYSATAEGLRFEQDPDFPTVYNLAAGNVHYTASGKKENDCDLSGEVTLEFPFDDLISGSIKVDVFAPTMYHISIDGVSLGARYDEFWDCDDDSIDGPHPWVGEINVIYDGPGSFDQQFEGEAPHRVADGQYVEVRYDEWVITYRWHFEEFGPNQDE